MKLSIMSTIIAIICGALAAPTTEGQDTPNSGLGSRGVASGCYPFALPRCGLSETYCQCADGRFYDYNGKKGCNPPGGIISESVTGIPGYTCT
ncbi:hypothetical protein BO85DRAFT_445719 [Aspergillus piperis CBS 112811]|uniref:Extracellular membrane protein CFEM domain-containing protein n=1 Tax=Aspergillus piperis CBS 112811 TaxID=1448313 RepID=A0A8G1R907_9EURO|nr:hypothetical protein BO85DRAFT_445719 [Aspergillus piperis CBS 112811]RAH62306.1 hypothetical protein BO85DRAFT_445719 [Aspergillus piperis CBS 112811]